MGVFSAENVIGYSHNANQIPKTQIEHPIYNVLQFREKPFPPNQKQKPLSNYLGPNLFTINSSTEG